MAGTPSAGPRLRGAGSADGTCTAIIRARPPIPASPGQPGRGAGPCPERTDRPLELPGRGRQDLGPEAGPDGDRDAVAVEGHGDRPLASTDPSE